MMMAVLAATLTPTYKKRIAPDGQLKKRFWDALEQFTSDPFAAPLKTHRLTGKLSGC